MSVKDSHKRAEARQGQEDQCGHVLTMDREK